MELLFARAKIKALNNVTLGQDGNSEEFNNKVFEINVKDKLSS